VAPAAESEKYKFYVVATNTIGDSAPSQVIEIQAAVLPSVPISLRRTSDTEHKTQITIEWQEGYNGGSQVVAYQVWWNAGGEGPVNEILDQITEPTYTQVGLTTGEFYGFAVRQITEIGMSDLSA
jgi:hypothetical protein